MKTVFLLGILTCAALNSATARGEGASAQARPEGSKVQCLDAVSKSQELRDTHRVVEAREQLRVCAAAQCPAAIRSDCANWLAEVERALPTVVFAAKDASGADLSAVKVTMDGSVLTERLDGIALQVDPGEHTFRFEASGQMPLERKFVIQEAQKDRHELVTLMAATTALPQATTEGALPKPLPVAETGHAMGAQRILALVVGGVGIVGLAGGTTFAVMAASKKSTAESICPGTGCPTQAGVDDWNDVTTLQTISTVGFIVGGAAIAGATVLWFTAPHATGGPSAQVSFGLGSFQVKGTW